MKHQIKLDESQKLAQCTMRVEWGGEEENREKSKGSRFGLCWTSGTNKHEKAEIYFTSSRVRRRLEGGNIIGAELLANSSQKAHVCFNSDKDLYHKVSRLWFIVQLTFQPPSIDAARQQLFEIVETRSIASKSYTTNCISERNEL